MRIVSPVDHFGEAGPLLEAGADELYGGYVPAAWRERFSLLASPNQRTFAGAQIDSRDELAAIVALAHAHGATFSLTLNAPYYTDEQLPLLLDYVDEAVSAGIDGVILADLGILRILHRRYPQLEYHASTLAHLMNAGAVSFYSEQGVSRVIFPRHLTTAEMKATVARLPRMRFDAFLLVGKCPNTEGLCTFHHSAPDKIWPCEIPYRIEPLSGSSSASLRGAMLRQGSWAHSNRRHGCGLCAIPELLALGIFGVKLVGRGAPAAQKVQNVLLTRDFLELAGQGLEPATYRQRARKAHRARFGTPCSPNVCYYPEFYEAE